MDNAAEINIYYSLLGVCLTIFSFIRIDKKNLPSGLIMNLFNLLFFIPLYVLIAFKDMEEGFFLFVFLYQFILFLFYNFKSFSFRPIFPRNKDIFFWIVGFILVANFFITAYYNGFRIKFDLSDVYENRLAVRELSIPTILSYIKAASYYVGILTLMYALKKRNVPLILFVVILQLMSFAFGASKTQFFTIFICFIAFYFYTEKFKLWAPVALSLLLTLSIIEFKIFNGTSISDVWTRRALFMPGSISHDMYDFLQNPNNELLYLRGSIFRIFGFEDPYEAQHGFQRLIGQMYGGNEDTNANTGLLGNDYAQFGWWSLLIYPFLRVYILKLYDFCAIGVDKRIMVVLSIFIAFTYISGSFFTVLVNNGLLLVSYLLYCFPSKTISK
ncbi:hypothetical protein HX065_12610 [Myroides odoratimimus]|uniref:hypothetical protein n=1 Tax=Myroides odoratimimus TaxID=76832 RepID=UPI002578A6D1|nr:hypothetical protein [Myroides odoratimimus]MDM1460873.1 hypothetical protein [Myroides odoratimimus]